MRLSLDHLTVVDTVPEELAVVAAQVGCAGICLFLQSMEVLPRMPRFDLITDRAARRRTHARCRDLGVAVDLVYPFTLNGRSAPDDFLAGLEAAAELGADSVNALLYDRDTNRRADVFAGFCEIADGLDLRVAVEFYPPSQIASLRAARDLVDRVGRPGRVGITLDLLHLMRSGGGVADVAAVPPVSILVAQLCDGPAVVSSEGLILEAATQRRLPGQGVFDVAGFVAALPGGVPVTVEIPREDALVAGLPPIERATAAVAMTRTALGWPPAGMPPR
ncbi:sugar phosphate isomerase/epimerase family protein [Azospirillum agricola]|uniref:sugar phosphate isomerase/epimerase family protein n=1 Tax=Azospirillum agricola TaxID=1720247 RepID=UPI000A0F2CA0|nr:TIM barrel protein [Azospirillum agricola]SMH37689.1 Sugar phosphate isomerase/epimerase [Azospirillum lipoferum]